jgi:tetratricopeptide (TPR) repeat protein
MKKLGLLLCLWLGLAAPLAAQYLPTWYEPAQFYWEGVELFDRQKYEAALGKFERYLNAAHPHDARQERTTWRAEAQLYKARCAFHMLKYNAEASFRAFLAEHPSHAQVPVARYHLAKLHFIKQRYEQAAPLLKRLQAERLAPAKQRDLQFMQGYVYYRARQFARAERALRPLTQKLGSEHARANYYYGLVLYKQGKLAEALDAFRQISEHQDFQQKVPAYITSILLKKGRHADLKRYAEQLLERSQQYQQQGLILQNLGTAYYETGDYEQALEYLRKSELQAKKGNSSLFFIKGLTLLKLEAYQRAGKSFEKVAQQEDSLAQGASYYLGFCYLQSGEPEEARLAFRRAQSLGQNPDFQRDGLFQYAKLSFETEYLSEAIQAFKTYLKRYPEAPKQNEAQAFLAEALYYSNDFQASINYFRSTKLSDKRVKRAYQKACLYYGLYKYEHDQRDSAQYFLEKAVSLGIVPAYTNGGHFWLGELMYDAARYLDAARHYNDFVEGPQAAQHPKYEEGWLGLGWCHMQEENYKTARMAFKKVANRTSLRREQPENYAEANLRLGDIAFVQKQYKQAERYYRTATQVHDSRRDYGFFQLGMSLLRQEQYEAAIRNFKKLVAQFENAELRDEALMRIADTYLTWTKDYENAKAYAQQLIDQHPNSAIVPRALLTMGSAAMNQQEQGQAKQYYRRVIEDYGTYEDEASKAVDLLCSVVSADECSKMLKQYRQEHPEYKKRLEAVSFNTARELFYNGKPQQALEQLNSYIADYPNGPNYYTALLLRGKAYRQLGQSQQAQQDLKKVYSTEAATNDRSPALLEAGQLHEQQGDYEAALKLYERAVKTAASNFDGFKAQFAQAELLAKTDQHFRSAQVYQTLLANENLKDYSKTRARVGWGHQLYEQGKRDSAQKLFEHVAEHNKSAFGAESQYMLAKLLHQQGDYKASMEAVGKMKKDFPAYNTWRAKAFFVVVDNYLAQDKRLHAMETLKSLVSRAPNKELKQRAQSRLDKLRQAIEAEQQTEAQDTTEADTTALPEGTFEQTD